MKIKNYFFKFTLLFVTLCSFYLKAQTVSTAYATQINATFANLDKSKIPQKLLVDYAMEFAELSGYNGTLTNENIVNRGQFTSIYNTLLMARVNANVTGLINPNTFRTNWENIRQPNKIVLSGLYYKYNEFKPDAPNNTITITNGKLYDKFVNGVWQNPYNEKQVFAMASPIIKFNKLTMQVQLPSALWYTNQANTVQSIAIDFSDGLGYQTTAFGQIRTVTYTAPGLKEWKYKLTLTTGQVLYSHSKIFIDGQVPPTTTTNTTQQRTIFQPCTVNAFGIDQVEFTGTRAYAGQVGNAILEIDYAGTNSCSTITKPLIVVEGFDSGLLGIENVLGEVQFSDFIQSSFPSGNLFNEISTYDIIYINFKNGSDDLHRNAYLVEDIIKWVNSVKVGTIPNVVLGQSMGGILARYALRDMENQFTANPNIPTWQHQTNLYISHDAPHQGANFPLGILAFARHLINQFVSTPIGDFNINITGQGGSVTIEDLEALLNATGTKQLIINNIEGTFSNNNSLGDTWRTELRNLGYPQLTRNIAISNGSHCALTQPYAPLDNLFTLTGDGQTGALIDFLLSKIPFLNTATFITLAVLFNEPSLLVGILPGNSKFNFDFYGKALPITGASNQIYHGNVSFTKTLFKLFGWTPRITVNLTNKDYNSPSIPSYDIYSGGFFQSFISNSNTISDPDFAFLASFGINITSIPSFNFIPTTSALDIGKGNIVLNDDDYLKKYTANIALIAPKTTPFANYTTSFNTNGINERHISFNTRNGDWLATELDTNEFNNQIFDCTYICADDAITGNNMFCTTATYSVLNLATTYEWSISSGQNLATITAGNNTNQITLTATNPSLFGYVTINLNYGSERCGTRTIQKIVYVGKPLYNGFIPIDGSYSWVPRGYSANNGVSFPVNSTATSYKWTISLDNDNLGPGYSCNGVSNPYLARFNTISNGINNNPSTTAVTPNQPTATWYSSTPNASINWGRCSGNYLLSITLINDCGEVEVSSRYVTVGSPANNPCQNNTTITSTYRMIVSPNPIRTYETTINLTPNHTPCEQKDLRPQINYREIYGENYTVKMYNLNGELKYAGEFVLTQDEETFSFRVTDINLNDNYYILEVLYPDNYKESQMIIIDNN